MEGGRRKGEEGRAKQGIGKVQGSSSGCGVVHMHRQGACSAQRRGRRRNAGRHTAVLPCWLLNRRVTGSRPSSAGRE